ncbi:ferredoxin-thioredoxin reductase variable chain [Synechococcus sp. Nb3U1]|uniref:ferredoxin-thioredoxin reductase variable chain n=1 Tax=Synechococcus sp. Nb3U1 TaxID=1914529 RepID=UPI001F29CF02|nr:ferredoxin-thioredoxin reductase variable chain [Synechococcus sp. Nb3U1]MCF2972373.1 ferredoxin-thioredoxin reductase variable chain [Synechococcus sp. Nb3U1]
MNIGDRVRVRTSVIVYHHPEYRNQPFDIKGMEGELKAVIRDWNGRPISANFPFQVQFSGKFRAHLQADELEVIESIAPSETAA